MDTLAASPVIWAALASALTWTLSHWWHRRKLKASLALNARLQMEVDQLRNGLPSEKRRAAADAAASASASRDHPASALHAPKTRSKRYRLIQAMQARYFPLGLRRRRAGATALAFLDTAASTHHSSGPNDLN